MLETAEAEDRSWVVGLVEPAELVKNGRDMSDVLSRGASGQAADRTRGPRIRHLRAKKTVASFVELRDAMQLEGKYGLRTSGPAAKAMAKTQRRE